MPTDSSVIIKTYVPLTEFSSRFVQGMADRMGVSFHKYGSIKDAYPHKVDAIESLKKRLRLYEETGNTEWLIDVANFAMIEFELPAHAKAHYSATDSDKSPGRKFWSDSEFSSKDNKSED